MFYFSPPPHTGRVTGICFIYEAILPRVALVNKTRDFSSRNLEQNVRNVIARSSEIKEEGGGVVAGWQKACLSSLTTAAGIGRLRVQISCQGIPTSLNIPPVHWRGDGDQMLLMMMMGVGSFCWFLAGRFLSSAARMNIYCSDASLSFKFIYPLILHTARQFTF